MDHASPCAATIPIRTPDGVGLFHRDWGDGPPVVFVASWSLPSDSWAYQMLGLSEAGCRCVAYDRRGHGRSDDPGRGFDFDTLADDLAAVLEALDLRGAMLVGFSMGTAEIVRYLTRHETSRTTARMRAYAELGISSSPCHGPGQTITPTQATFANGVSASA